MGTLKKNLSKPKVFCCPVLCTCFPVPSGHLLQLLGIVDALDALKVLDKFFTVVGADLFVSRTARSEVEATLDQSVLAAALQNAAEAVGILHVLGVEEAASTHRRLTH